MSYKNRPSKFEDKATTFIRSTDKFININDPEIVNELKNKNHSLLWYLYIKNGEKEKALQVLKDSKYSRFTISNLKMIIYTYIYFKDFEGALEFIKKYKESVVEIIPLECLINIHLIMEKGDKNEIFTNIIRGMSYFYDKNLLEVLKNMYLSSTDKLEFKKVYEEVQEIIMNQYYNQLTYKKAKYLYKTMPNKFPFLKKMVKTNPFIKRKYYFQYANIVGINKEDILRILRVKYRNWAMCIALINGWVDETLKIPFEKENKLKVVFLNKNGDWNLSESKLSKIMCFSKVYKK